MKGLFYFNHDDNAHSDKKIRRLLLRSGIKAYGLYWLVLEEMHSENGYFDFDEESLELLAWDTRMEIEELKEIIESMIDIGLFIRAEDGRIYSNRMMNDITAYQQQVEKGKQMITARWSKNKGGNTDSNTDSNTENNNAVIQKEKKRTEKKRIEKNKTKQNRTEQNDAAADDNLSPTPNAAAAADVVDVAAPTDSTAPKEQAKSISAEIDSLQAVSDQLDKLIAENTTESVDDSILIDDADEIIFGEEDKIEVPQEPEEPNADEILNTLIDPVLKADTDKLRQELISIGLSESVADIKLIMHDNDYIRSKIELLKAQSNIQNPSAWLLKAIENDYKPNVPTKPVSQPSSTDLLSEKDDFQEFQKQFKRLMNYDFNNKRLYTQAVTTLGTPSAVVKVLNSFAKYKGTDGLKDIIHRHNIRSFDDLLTNEKAMGSLTAYAAAENYKEMQRDPAYIALMQKMGADKEAI